MSGYTWIKLYIEILDDPKVGMMPDWAFRSFIQFLLVARETNKDGLLGPVAALAWRLRSSEDDVLKSLRTMEQIGIVADTPDGWLMINFAKRQASIDGAERVRQSRERKRVSNEEVTKRYEKCNDAAVTSSSSTSISSSDSSSEGERMQGEGGVFRAYEQNIGLITPALADGLRDAIDTYSVDWVMTGIQYAATHEKRSLAYITGCLKGWRRDGLAQPPKGNGNKPAPPLKGDNTAFFKQLASQATKENPWLPEKKLLKSSDI
jgi:DnaD/phage-associated family protein